MNYKPAYTADEFKDKVCSKLENIYQSYEESAQRYDKAIETTQKTIRTCNEGINKADRHLRLHAKVLNRGLQAIGAVIIHGDDAGERPATQWSNHATL